MRTYTKTRQQSREEILGEIRRPKTAEETAKIKANLDRVFDGFHEPAPLESTTPGPQRGWGDFS